MQLFTMISNLIKIGTTTWACANFDHDLFEIVNVFFLLLLNQNILNTLVLGH